MSNDEMRPTMSTNTPMEVTEFFRLLEVYCDAHKCEGCEIKSYCPNEIAHTPEKLKAAIEVLKRMRSGNENLR